MKLNFLKVLNNQNNTPEEIAEQIIGLEQKQIECEKQLDALRQQAKELRQKKFCGEAVSDAQITDADRKVENASLDLEAVKESIVKLNDKLHKTYQAIIDNAHIVTGERVKALEPERDRLFDELIRAKAKVFVISQQLSGYMAEVRLRRGQFFDDGPVYEQRMKEEVAKLMANVNEPTYYSKCQDINHYGSWASNLKIHEESERLLNNQRVKMGVPVKAQV
jgi:hypothetical protein